LQREAELKRQRIPSDFEHERRLVNNILNIVTTCRRNLQFLSHPALFSMVRTVTIYSENNSLKKIFWNELVRDVKEFWEGDEAKRLVLFFLTDLFEDVVRVRPLGAQHYFTMAQTLLSVSEKRPVDQLVLPHLNDIYHRLTSIVFNEPP